MDEIKLASQHFFKGLHALNQGDLVSAESCLLQALSIVPDRPSVLTNLSNVYTRLENYSEALAYAKAAVEADTRDPLSWLQQGAVQLKLKQYQDALQSLDCSIEIDESIPEAHNNRAGALIELNRLNEALASYDKAISLKPDFADAYGNLGFALKKLNRLDEALASYNKAISLRPDFAEAHADRGDVLKKMNRLDEALASYDKAISLKPDMDFFLGERLHTKMKVCNWTDLDTNLKEIEDGLLAGKRVIRPGQTLSCFDRLDLQLFAAKIYVEAYYPTSIYPSIPLPPKKQKKIKVGYYSCDFLDHPGASLMAELFEVHDRNDFDFYAFSYTPRTNDYLQKRISDAFDYFIDVNNKTDQEIIDLSIERGIDIAIHRNGHTARSRNGIFWGRCAPIQVSYLGYPGTTGAQYIDYIVADRVVIPYEHHNFYSEKIVYLPASYMVNDSKRRVSDKVFTRTEFGLPQKSFVFCCFNKNYKITPETFECWMRILNRVHKSVLWLFEENEIAASNLKREADLRGINPTRLVFAKRIPREEHLARHKLADLFLDTLPYNAHTTASDALWAGLPVLTCIGNSFVARVAASLLTALRMPELIVDDMQKYEELAVALANDPSRISAVREKLERNRLTSNLFSGKAFARNIEAAYKEMYARYKKGLEPDHIIILGETK